MDINTIPHTGPHGILTKRYAVMIHYVFQQKLKFEEFLIHLWKTKTKIFDKFSLIIKLCSKYTYNLYEKKNMYVTILINFLLFFKEIFMYLKAISTIFNIDL